jgi:hypothetical protein
MEGLEVRQTKIVDALLLLTCGVMVLVAALTP